MTRPPAVREKLIETHLRKGVRLAGGEALKFTGYNGLPDRIVFLPGGRVHLVELKTIAGRLTERQKLLHRNFERLGFPVHVLWSKQDVEQWLSTYAPVPSSTITKTTLSGS